MSEEDARFRWLELHSLLPTTPPDTMVEVICGHLPYTLAVNSTLCTVEVFCDGLSYEEAKRIAGLYPIGISVTVNGHRFTLEDWVPVVQVGELTQEAKTERRSPPITIWFGTGGEA